MRVFFLSFNINMATTKPTTDEPAREHSVSAVSLEKEKIEVEQREHDAETAPSAEDLEFKKQERKVVAKLDLVRKIPSFPLSLPLLLCPPLAPLDPKPNQLTSARVFTHLQYICPILILLQLISFLDRGNIGYAATQGLLTDINLHGTQLNTAISLFYPLYILAEFPAALVAKRLGFNRVIPTAALCWGIICLSNGFVKNFAGLCVCRMLLGAFEVSRGRGMALTWGCGGVVGNDC